MKTVEDIKAILTEVHFPGLAFHIGGKERFYLQATFKAPCAKSGLVDLQYTRKWYISGEATKSEVIQTALKCVLTAVEHEARETFTYKGRPIFAPHCHVDKLWELCGPEGISLQEERE